MKNILMGLIVLGIACVFSVNAQTDIRKVDFKNFTFEPFCVGDQPQKVTVQNGEFSKETEEDGYTDRFFFSAAVDGYGDVDGDGKDEAIISSICNTGGTGNFSEGFIYTMKNGKPSLLSRIEGGDRAFGGIIGMTIEKGIVMVDRNDAGENGAACCAEFAVKTNYKWNGKKLVESGKAERRELYPATRIAFQEGRSSGTVKAMIPAGEMKRFDVGANKGQTMTVNVAPDTDAAVNLRFGDAETTEDTGRLNAELNEKGDYTFEVYNNGDTEKEFTVEVIIITKGTKNPPVGDSPDKIDSIYTELSDTKCKTLESNPDEGGSYVGECAGVGGYKLQVLEGDLRQTVNIVQSASGNKWELDFWSIKIGFSAVGEKAEWRVIKNGKTVKPIALIIRYNLSENPEDSAKITSYLLVTKIDGETACVTDVVKPSKDQNAKARQLADNSTGKPCYSRE